MAIIYIDNKPFEVQAGKNLLETCLSLGFNLPYFCWHPAMGSVGACRQCAIKVFKDAEDTRGRLVMACMEGARDNLYLSVNDPAAKAFRAGIIELLMTNHPHDCPVCDEGGSCHLQDMTVMTGHNYRRYNFPKRTYNNQYLGPFLNHEMNRCIQCYRCVRFYKDYAGGKDLDVFAAHNNVYFGREKDGVLESEFSGNLAEVCPTGVFTDKTLKEHYTRKWDLTASPSICQHCSLGCNVIAGERYGELRQITNRFNSEVNGYFICDRGRFGYEFVNSINRITQPLIRGNHPDVVNKETLLAKLADIINGGEGVIGIGSPRASLESNFALMELVGQENFYQGISETESDLMALILDILNSGQIHTPSLKEVEEADCILILGEDVTNTAPRLALSLRQAVQNTPLEKTQGLSIPSWHDAARRELIQQEKEDCFIFYPVKTKLDEIAAKTFHTAPDDIARIGYAIANVLDNNSPAVDDLDEEPAKLIKSIAASLKSAKRPLIITGTSCLNPSVIKAAFNIAVGLKLAERRTDLCFILPHCNSLGLALLGGKSYTKALDKNNPRAAIILENDLYRSGSEENVSKFLRSFENVIALDYLNNSTTNAANVLIPAASFAEGDGTLINNEGRAQRFFQVFSPKSENVLESWRWLNEISLLKNGGVTWQSPEEVLEALVNSYPQFAGVEKVSHPAEYRIAGQKIPRETQRFSGRTAILANINVSEPKPPEDPDSALSFTMEGFKGIPPAPLTPFFWSPGWNSNQASHKYQTEVGGPLKGSQGIRLFKESSEFKYSFKNSIPEAFKVLEGEWLLLPLPHIFGSEELSVYTRGIEELSPKPYLAMSEKDAQRFNAQEGDVMHLQIGNAHFMMPMTIRSELPEGCAGIPYQIGPFQSIEWPAKGLIKKEAQ